MKGLLDNFYNIDALRGTLASDQAWQASWNLAVTASATAAVHRHLGHRPRMRSPR
jgi:non-heme chloroperoxidase